MIDKPYPRIWRPSHNNDGWSDLCEGYENDLRYINENEKRSLLSAARLIIRDLEQLWDYIEPCDSHQDVYSYRIYELLLRTCTEFEANCKGILLANNYIRNPFIRNLNITDYKKLNRAMKLNEYEITYNKWTGEFKTIKPFLEWGNTDDTPLSWYQAYNQVKHNRYSNFPKANLKNLLKAIDGLICILFAQFTTSTTIIGHSGVCAVPIELTEFDLEYFHIKVPTFSDSEQYDFNWRALSTQVDAFNIYQF